MPHPHKTDPLVRACHGGALPEGLVAAPECQHTGGEVQHGPEGDAARLLQTSAVQGHLRMCLD